MVFKATGIPKAKRTGKICICKDMEGQERIRKIFSTNGAGIVTVVQ